MSPLRRLLLLTLVSALAGCQLYFINTDDEDENGSGSGRDVTLDIVGTDNGLFSFVELWVTGVVFERESGATTTFDFSGRPVDLLRSESGETVVSGASLPSGNYEFLRLRAEGGEGLNLSVVDDGRGELDLAISGNGIDIEITPVISGGGRWTVVVHTASAVVPDGDFLYRYRQTAKTAYVVRNGRAGTVEGTIPYTQCSQNRPAGDVAVYVHDASATAPTDIRGRSGVNEPVLSFAARQGTDGTAWEFRSPLIPEGEWQVSYTCRALSDDPDQSDSGQGDTADIVGDLRDTARDVDVVAGQAKNVDF